MWRNFNEKKMLVGVAWGKKLRDRQNGKAAGETDKPQCQLSMRQLPRFSHTKPKSCLFYDFCVHFRSLILNGIETLSPAFCFPTVFQQKVSGKPNSRRWKHAISHHVLTITDMERHTVSETGHRTQPSWPGAIDRLVLHELTQSF